MLCICRWKEAARVTICREGSTWMSMSSLGLQISNDKEFRCAETGCHQQKMQVTPMIPVTHFNVEVYHTVPSRNEHTLIIEHSFKVSSSTFSHMLSQILLTALKCPLIYLAAIVWFNKMTKYRRKNRLSERDRLQHVWAFKATDTHYNNTLLLTSI